MHLTGYDALAAQSGGGDGPGVLLEALLGGAGALIVLAFVFASFLAIVPLLMAVPAIMTCFLAVYGLTTFTGVSPIVQFLIALIGLGVAIDYSLIIVVRWREELAHGPEGDEAIVRAMATAGRAVVFSGTTVAIGLLSLIVLPLPFLRSVGYGGMLIPLVSVLVAMTLLPVVLHSWGHKLDWPHRRTDDKAARAWTRWAGGVVRHRWAAAGVALRRPRAARRGRDELKPGISDVNTIAKQGDAKDGPRRAREVRHRLGRAAAPRGARPRRLARPGGRAPSARSTASTARWPRPTRRGGRRHRGGRRLRDPRRLLSEGRDLVAKVRDAAHAQGDDVRLGGQPASRTTTSSTPSTGRSR